jgi:hypothetical protein
MVIGASPAAAPRTGAPDAPRGPVEGVCESRPKPTQLNFTLKDLGGVNVKLAEFKGKVIVLNRVAGAGP